MEPLLIILICIIGNGICLQVTSINLNNHSININASRILANEFTHIEKDKVKEGSSRSETYKMQNGLILLHAQRPHTVSDVKKSQLTDNSQSINYHVRKKEQNNETVFKILEFNRFGVNITIKKNDFIQTNNNLLNHISKNDTNIFQLANSTENCLNLTGGNKSLVWESDQSIKNNKTLRQNTFSQQIVKLNNATEDVKPNARIKRNFRKVIRKIFHRNIDSII
ncbi:uncharacterized protein LOC100200441 [Hydra vulgaris]|uniref:Uncharacterized protein LOC100200441 n=1 Tax=Hydra vulgaris TaxID=6087 RepID=A0ABM4CP83_HYDVU